MFSVSDQNNCTITFHFPFSLAFLMTLFIISVKTKKFSYYSVRTATHNFKKSVKFNAGPGLVGFTLNYCFYEYD